jgi:hypothetical protein
MTVTVSGNRTMSFSDEAWTALGSPEAMRFLVDKDRSERVIGFQGCARGEPNSHAITPRSRTASAVALLKYLRYDTRTARRYTLHVEDGQPPYIDLNEDAPAVTSNRRKR